LSPPDVPDAAERFAASPLLPRDEAGPVFAEPWQAQAFALAVQLPVFSAMKEDSHCG
jgi:hypothetical protein